MREFATLLPFFKDNKRAYFLGIFWLIITDLLQLIIPKILGLATDSIESMKEPGLLLKYALLILGIALLVAVSRFFWRIYVIGSARKLEYYLRNKMFSHLLNLDPKFYDGNNTGDLMALVTNDINAVRATFSVGLIMFIDAFFMTIFIVTIMFTTIDYKLTFFALLPMPLIVFIVTRLNKEVHNRFKKVQGAFASLTNMMQENISAIRVIKAFVQEKNQVKKFNKYNQNIVDTNINLTKITAILYPLVFFLAGLSMLIVFGFGSILVIKEVISLGDFVSFNVYLGMLTWPMLAAGWLINIVERGTASMSRINAVLDEKPSIYDSSAVDEKIDTIEGKIEFKNLNFSYGEKNLALKNFSLEIKKGETVAFFGRTGSGKSTVANLLLRLYKIEEGQIYIDDTEIHKIPLKTLRENIGYVPQESFLFSTTIKDNIAFFNKNISFDKIVSAAKTACIYEDIENMKDGFDTVVGERGITLSGGQKQRIAIARAIIKNPKILILDDSLSAVDTNTEEKLLRKIKDLRKNKTTIIIANRISTIKHADKIVVLEDGEITQIGKHEDLINCDGLYSRLYNKQLLEEEIGQ